MGPNTPILDSPGDDFTVYEGNDGTSEGYSVYLSNEWNAGWLSCGADTGTASFDVSETGLTQARYVKVVDDGDYQSGQYAGFDLDAIHFFSPTGIETTGPAGTGMSYMKLSISPNPFNEKTDIRYGIFGSTGRERTAVNIAVYDALGRRVRSLAKDTKYPGQYTITWDGRDDGGLELQAGVYFVRVNTDGLQNVQKLVVLK